MIRFKGIKKVDGEILDLEVESSESGEIDAKNLLLFPSLIDPHVHFRFPGDTHKETWIHAAKAAFRSGITLVFDMPNNRPSITTVEALKEKKKNIENILLDAGLPLKFGLYLGASRDSLAEISKAKGHAVGIKIFMGGSTGSLLLDGIEDQKEAFQRAAESDLVVAVHAESETILQERKKLYPNFTEAGLHSKIRDRSAAIRATHDAIELAGKYKTKLYLLHVSTKEEIELIREAKKSGIRVLAEVTPHHLTFTEDDYPIHGTHLIVNPPIRGKDDREALWRAILEGVIDTIGSDHAPHTLAEKSEPPYLAPAGIAGIEFTLSTLITGKLAPSKIVELTRTNISRFFGINPPRDWAIVDMNAFETVRDELLETKAGHAPYCGKKMQGKVLYLIAGEKLINLEKTHQRGQRIVHPS